MMQAGTPCPYEGLIGQQAKEAWEKNPSKVPGYVKTEEKESEKDEG